MYYELRKLYSSYHGCYHLDRSAWVLLPTLFLRPFCGVMLVAIWSPVSGIAMPVQHACSEEISVYKNSEYLWYRDEHSNVKDCKIKWTSPGPNRTSREKKGKEEEHETIQQQPAPPTRTTTTTIPRWRCINFSISYSLIDHGSTFHGRPLNFHKHWRTWFIYSQSV